MKKKKVTYGISGLMECQTVIKIGKKSTMKVHFSDGSMTAMGVNPATFTTSDFMVQHAIENSNDYKRGRIYTVRSIVLDEELKIEKNVAGSGVERALQNAVKQEEAKKEAKEAEAEAEKGNNDVTPEQTTEDAVNETAEEQKAEDEAEEEVNLRKVKVSDLAAAKDYLADKFGISRTALRSQKAILEHAAANGIEFEGLE